MDQIRKEHILKAIQEINENGIPKGRQSSKYDLIFDGKNYPPLLVVSYAKRIATGNEFPPNTLGGGPSSEAFKLLNKHNFKIVLKEGFNDDEKIFSNRLKRIENKSIEKYFELLDNLVEDLSLKDTKNLVFSTARNRLSFQIGKRVCLIVYYNNKFDFITSNLYLLEDLDKEIFTSPSNAFLYKSVEKNETSTHYNAIKNAVEIEVKRDNHTEPKTYDNSAFRKAVFDKEYRNNFLNKKTNMEYFTKKEFDLLNEYDGKDYLKSNAVHKEVSSLLKNPHNKTKYWAEQLKIIALPNSIVKIIRNPINQAQKFQGYTWAKIYPSKNELTDKWLAITIGISDNHYEIKIDTVGLKDSDDLRKKYIDFRGDYINSKIVIRHQKDKLTNWRQLLEKSKKDIDQLMSYWEEVKSLKGGSKVSNKIKHPLNQILYGPPGTGKTYKTKEIAVAIAAPNFKIPSKLSKKEQREEINKKYQELFDAGQVVFTTFHQSFSYEDFVEGIKPETISENITYDTIPGVFKELCEKADTKSSSNFEEILSQFKKDLIDKESIKINTGSIEFDVFYRGGKTFKINPKESKNTNPQYPASIENILKLYKGESHEGMYNPSYVKGILTYLYKTYSLKPYSVLTKGNERNYVLIIDEINRGNVSAIFGELITLIEEDKRLGNDEPLKVKLPYSKAPFGVPSNLYLIGTMNTADRSVEALDTALRRRFSFKEIMPNIKLLEGAEVSGIKLDKLLERINNRIEVLLDRDHTIGHSYFLKVIGAKNKERKLEEVFKDNIIPLLQEYFFGDYSKIGLILGNEFVDVKEQTSTKILAKFDTREEIDLDKKYTLKSFEDNNLIKAIQSILKDA